MNFLSPCLFPRFSGAVITSSPPDADGNKRVTIRISPWYRSGVTWEGNTSECKVADTFSSLQPRMTIPDFKNGTIDLTESDEYPAASIINCSQMPESQKAEAVKAINDCYAYGDSPEITVEPLPRIINGVDLINEPVVRLQGGLNGVHTLRGYAVEYTLRQDPQSWYQTWKPEFWEEIIFDCEWLNEEISTNAEREISPDNYSELREQLQATRNREIEEDQSLMTASEHALLDGLNKFESFQEELMSPYFRLFIESLSNKQQKKRLQQLQNAGLLRAHQFYTELLQTSR